MSDKQTNIPTVEETNSLLSAPVRPAGYEQPEVEETAVESNTATEEAVSPSFACDQCDFVAKSAIGLKSHQRTHN